MESPPLSPALIVGLFFLFPGLVIPPILAFKLVRMRGSASKERGPQASKAADEVMDATWFFRTGSVALIAFGVTALLRSVFLREPYGVQFMPIGFGAAVYSGLVLYSRL
jgi:hypothetical protein